MNILTPSWLASFQHSYAYSVDWSHPITNALSYINVTNNLMQAPTYSQFGQGTFANTGVSTALDIGGIGIKGTDANSKLKWTGRGPKVNATAGTVLVFMTCGVAGGNRFLFRLDDGTQANSLFLFLPNATGVNYGWWLGGGAQSYKNVALTTPVGRPFVAGITWDTASPFQDCWLDGKTGRNTDAFSTADTSNYNLNLGNAESQNISFLDSANSRIYWIAFWDRVLGNSEITYLNLNPMCFLVPAEAEMPILRSALAQWQLYFSKNSGAYEPVTTTSLGVKSADASTDADETKILIPRL